MPATVLEAPKATPTMAGVGSTGDAFTDKVKALMDAGNATPEPKKEEVKEPAKADKTKEEPAKTEAPKAKSLLDGFDQSTKKAEPVKEEKAKETETPSDKEINIANLRKQMEATQSERDGLKARLKEMESKPNVPEDYAQLKADHDLLNSELKKVKLEATPEFQRKYNAKLEKTSADIQKILGNTEINPLEFMDLLKAPESKERNQKIAEALEGVDKFSESRLSGAIAEYDRTRDERAAELSQPDEQLLKLSEAEKQARAKQSEELNGLIHNVIQETEQLPDMAWLKENPELPEEWNKALGETKKLAVDLWTKPMPPKVQAQMALSAALTPLLFNLLQHRTAESTAEITKLNEELSKYRKTTPTTSAARSETTAPTAAETKVKAKDGFLDSFKAAMANG